MANALVPTVGRQYVYNKILAPVANWRVGLTQGLIAPALTDVLTTYTINVATFGGYATAIVPAPAAPVVDPNNNAESPLGVFTFTATGGSLPQTIYDWYLYDSVSGDLIAACVLDAPQTVTNPGDSITFTIDSFAGQLSLPY